MEITFALDRKTSAYTRFLGHEALQQGITMEDIDGVLGELERMVRRKHRLIIFLGVCFYLYLILVIAGGACLGGFADITGKQALLLVAFMVSLLLGGLYRAFNLISGLELGIKDHAKPIISKYSAAAKSKGMTWIIPKKFPACVQLYIYNSAVQQARRLQNQNNPAEPVVIHDNQAENSLSQGLLNNPA